MVVHYHHWNISQNPLHVSCGGSKEFLANSVSLKVGWRAPHDKKSRLFFEDQINGLLHNGTLDIRRKHHPLPSFLNNTRQHPSKFRLAFTMRHRTRKPDPCSTELETSPIRC